MTPKPSIWPHKQSHLLAKSADRSEGDGPETLADHTWLVLCRLRDFIVLRQDIPNTLARPDLWHLLYWGVFLHDFGKAMPGFQMLLRGQKEYQPSWAGQRHEVFSLAFLDWIAPSFSDEDLMHVSQVIASHHRDFDRIFEVYPRRNAVDWQEHFTDFSFSDVQLLHEWLASCGYAWAQHLGLDTFGVSPVSIDVAVKPDFIETAAKRISVYLKRLKKHEKEKLWQLDVKAGLEIALRGMICNADHAASAHYPAPSTLQLSATHLLETRGITSPHAHQLQAQETTGNAILIAPTGSGKTEASLLWAANNLGAGVNRLFYTLPYQASMNAMDLRLKETFDVDPTVEQSNVGLLHGRSTLTVFKRLMEQDAYTAKQAKFQAREAKNAAKLNYPPVRVFSPFQMLKAPYRLKGYEAQLVDYFNALFIFDEIHAYEISRLAMILGLMQYLHEQFGANFFVMTATFPKLLQNELQQVLNNPPVIRASDALFESLRRHRLELINGEIVDAANLEQIYQTALTRQAVLVVCNLVDRAQQVYDFFIAKNNAALDVELLHGRFNMRDRNEKEKRINAIAGHAVSRPRTPTIFIGTQVVEVSLDVDFDTIYTEPAPLEALMQRFGRVNRKQKLPELAPVHVFTAPIDGQKIYDERLVQNTLQVFETVVGQPIDEGAVSHWLDTVYSEEYCTEWRETFAAALKEFKAACLDTLQAFNSERMLREQFFDMFDSVEILPECFLEEYEELFNARDMRARELLVSISWGRRCQIANAKLLYPFSDNKKHNLDVVALPYTSERGLDFSPLYND